MPRSGEEKKMDIYSKAARLHRAINYYEKRYGRKWYPSYWDVEVDEDLGKLYLVYYSPLYQEEGVDPWIERGGDAILRRAKVTSHNSYVRDYYKSDGETTWRMEVAVID